jgi:hypothetical protein
MFVDLKGEQVARVLIQGHGGGTSGSDLVCAAVSAVAQTALQGLLHYAGGTIRWQRKKGEISIHVRPECEDAFEHTSATKVILRTLVMGVRSIAGEHPDRVAVYAGEDGGRGSPHGGR